MRDLHFFLRAMVANLAPDLRQTRAIFDVDLRVFVAKRTTTAEKTCASASRVPALKKYPMGYYTLYNILGYAGYFFLCFIMNSLYMGYFLHIPQKIRFIMEIK